MSKKMLNNFTLDTEVYDPSDLWQLFASHVPMQFFRRSLSFNYVFIGAGGRISTCFKCGCCGYNMFNMLYRTSDQYMIMFMQHASAIWRCWQSLPLKKRSKWSKPVTSAKVRRRSYSEVVSCNFGDIFLANPQLFQPKNMIRQRSRMANWLRNKRRGLSEKQLRRF